MNSIFDQIRSGAEKAAFEADKLRKITTIKSEVRSLKSNVEEAYLEAGRTAFRLHQTGSLSRPELTEVCARIDELQSQIDARERKIEQIRDETYETPASPPEGGYVCPNGHGELSPGAQFCPTCGAQGLRPSPATAGPSCPACGAAVTPETRFCPSCGAEIPEPSTAPPAAASSTTCPNCGIQVPAGAMFCPECGHRVSDMPTGGTGVDAQEEHTGLEESASGDENGSEAFDA